MTPEVIGLIVATGLQLVFIVWLWHQRSEDLGMLLDMIQKGAKDDSDRHLDSLAALSEKSEELRKHSHPLEPHDHAAYALAAHDHDGAYSERAHNHDAGYAPSHHDHPHTHEHVVHTHTLVNRSEHEENGKKVVVKQCAECDTVFRDKQD